MESTDTNESSETKVLETLRKLEVFSGRHLRDDEIIIFKDRLSKYPTWKLDRIDEYTGTLSNHVFKFLDELRPLSSSAKEPSLVFKEANPEFAKEAIKSIRRMLARVGNPLTSLEELEKAWKEEIKDLDIMIAMFPKEPEKSALARWKKDSLARHRDRRSKFKKERQHDKQGNDPGNADSRPTVQERRSGGDSSGVLFSRIQQVHKEQGDGRA